MIKVVCCDCDIVTMIKPGNTDGKDSHGFCQKCLDKYCAKYSLKPIEIFVPEGGIANEEALLKRKTY